MADSVSIGDLLTLANLIRASRLAQGLTRDELASATGLSPKFITHVEGAKPTAQLGKVMLLLGELGISLFAQTSVPISEKTASRATQRRRTKHDR
jgi:transcriptional regulator with XRE-family HTH domain